MDAPLQNKRIGKMIDIIMKVARGDYSAEVELSGQNDNLDSLAMGINMMIDDIRSLITDLREAEEKLKRKNQEIVEFTNMVTHDLRNPLTTMKNTSSLLKGDEDMCKLSEEGREILEMSDKAMNYMHELLEDLSTCARMEDKTLTLEKEDLDIAELIEQVLGRLKYQIDKKKIEVTTDYSDIHLPADRKVLTKVFMNLLGNAVNYIGDVLKPEIAIGCSSNNKRYEFYVQDNGLGIPEEAQKDIFQKFKRGNNVSGIKGTGLGLAIVKASVEAHGGEVWLESKEGEGTTFYFTLPKTKNV